MQKLFQALAVYLEKDTQVNKNDLLRRIKIENGKSKWILF